MKQLVMCEECTDQFKKNDCECILSKVLRSIERLYEKDFWLLEKDLYERSITHKLAEHLQPLFSDYNVDCEYNGDETLGEYGKKVVYLDGIDLKSLTNNKGEVDFNSEKVISRIFPDILIHRRGCYDYNLCAIEVKKSTNNDKDAFEFDFKKLELYSRAFEGFKYKVGFFICFKTKSTEKKCSLKVFIGGKECCSYENLDFSHVLSV